MMTINYKCIGAALTGLAVGAVGGWFFTKRKYEQYVNDTIAYEETENEAYEEFEDEDIIVSEPEFAPTDNEVLNAARNKPPITEMVVEHNAFEEASSLSFDEATKVTNPDAIDIPYLINAKEFSSLNNYSKFSFIKFEDGVYVDEYGDPIDDVELYLSSKLMDYIEGSDKTEFYVRNDARAIDIEISVEEGNYNNAEDE